MILKIIGLILMAIGLLILGYFPTKEYQRSAMTSTGIWFSVLVFLIGIIIVVFL